MEETSYRLYESPETYNHVQRWKNIEHRLAEVSQTSSFLLTIFLLTEPTVMHHNWGKE